MPGIFVSYRRSGTSTTTYRLVDDLRGEFGPEQIFLDVESIDPGIPFAEAIKVSLSKSSIVLIMIGPEWASVKDDSDQARLQNQDDWVRQEVRAALNSNLRVIPVLVQGAEMPHASQLPEDIRRLTELNAFTLLPSQTHWSFDVNRLIENIKRADPSLINRKKPEPKTTENSKHYSYKVISGLVICGLFLLASFEGWEDASELFGVFVILIVGAGLCIAGLLDINKGKTLGFKGAITGISLNAIAAFIALIGSGIYALSGGNANYEESNDFQALAEFTDDTQQTQVVSQINLNGTWVNPTSTIRVTQADNNFSFVEYNTFNIQVGTGQGIYNNGSLEFRYYNSFFDRNLNGTGNGSNDSLSLEFYDPNSGQTIPITYFRE